MALGAMLLVVGGNMMTVNAQEVSPYATEVVEIKLPQSHWP